MIEILNGNGDGTFQPLVLYDPAPADSSTVGGDMVSGDFNRDGRPDLALQVRGAFLALHILINTTNGGTAPPTPTPLSAPTLLSPANNAKMPINQSIPFSWSAVPGAATYEIQFDDSSSFTNPLFAAQTSLTQTQTTQTFTSERRFWWRVRARTRRAGKWRLVRCPLH